MKKLKALTVYCKDPYENLALEEQLTMSAEEDEVTMYLWQNANTVVIGRNQNPWRECDVEAIKRDGVKLARRLSGGGAVYHDLGNLNFTFIAKDGSFDVEKQTEVILLACKLLGIESAAKNGRNDLTIDGKKFSGHAYYSSNGYNYHHGTLMVEVLEENLAKYLNVPDSKLKSKGVESVRSRITNMVDYMTDEQLLSFPQNILIEAVKGAMLHAFEKTYGMEAEIFKKPDVDEALMAKYGSDEWIYGRKIAFEKDIIHRFDWGEVEVQLAMKGEQIEDVKIYSDALETEVFAVVEDLLKSCRYDASDIASVKVPKGTSATANEILKLVASSI